MLGEEMPTAVISFERRRCIGMFSCSGSGAGASKAG
jgi:hypothetical protein